MLHASIGSVKHAHTQSRGCLCAYRPKDFYKPEDMSGHSKNLMKEGERTLVSAVAQMSDMLAFK